MWRETDHAKVLNVHPLELFADEMDVVTFADKAKISNAYPSHVYAESNDKLIEHLYAQLIKKDEQIQKLLNQLDRISLILDVSQKVNLLNDYK